MILSQGLGGVQIKMAITLGRHSYMGGTNGVPTDMVVGNFSSIGTGLTFITGQHVPKGHPEGVSTFPFNELWGTDQYHYGSDRLILEVGHDVWIGASVLVMNTIVICTGAIVGAGTILTKEVPPYAVVVGNPSRIVKYRFTEIQIEQLLKVGWWNWEDDKIREALPYMKDINRFLERYG
jgi:acetyltransferase-like isoleucine patch superfamily enzyme